MLLLTPRYTRSLARYHCPVKCDRCDNEATVHEVSIKGGKRHERHLCEGCAREQGVSAVQATPDVSSILQTFIALKSSAQASGTESKGETESAAAAPTSAAAASCPACGQTFAQFRTSGVLGCPLCYTRFESQLTPLLSRAHEGGTHHVGKSPASAKGGAGEQLGGASKAEHAAIDHDQRVAALRKSLEDAIAGEQYEKAAKLRDELQRLQLSKPQGLERDDAAGTSLGASHPRRRGNREDRA